MPEPEDQLRALAEHRASQVAPYDASTLAMRRRKRTPLLVGAVAAAVVIALVASAFALWPDDASRSVHVIAPSTSEVATTAPPTTTPTTSPPAPTCPPFEGRVTEQRGGQGVGATEVYWVQMASSACTDRVRFAAVLADGSVSAWRVHFSDGPVTYLSGASSGDHAVLLIELPEPTTIPIPYAETLVPAGPITDIVAIRQVTASTWGIEMPTERPFRAQDVDDVLTIDLSVVGEPRAERCDAVDGGFTAAIPHGWFAAFVGASPCVAFGTNDRARSLFTDAYDPVVQIDDRPDFFAPTNFEQILSSYQVDLGSGIGTVYETESLGGALMPAGDRRYGIVVRVGSRTLTVWAEGTPGPEYDERKIGVDTIARSLAAI